MSSSSGRLWWSAVSRGLAALLKQLPLELFNGGLISVSEVGGKEQQPNQARQRRSDLSPLSTSAATSSDGPSTKARSLKASTWGPSMLSIEGGERRPEPGFFTLPILEFDLWAIEQMIPGP